MQCQGRKSELPAHMHSRCLSLKYTFENNTFEKKGCVVCFGKSQEEMRREGGGGVDPPFSIEEAKDCGKTEGRKNIVIWDVSLG